MYEVGQKITLTDKERAFIRRRPAKEAFLAVIEFRGPRGRRYRPTRTAPELTALHAEERAQEIRNRPYAHGAYATSSAVYRVNALGYVQEVL